MIKKLSIALLFFTAFAVMMAHNIIGHHHADETITEQHDKDHHNDDGLDNLFSHFQHIGTTNQFVSTHQTVCVKQIDIPQSGIAFVITYNFNFSDTGEPVPIILPDHPPIYSSSGADAFALRGPPSFTV